MKKIEQMQDIRIKCDMPGCGWVECVTKEQLPDWHRKPCPKCGAGEIVSDHDLEVFRYLKFLCALDEYMDPDGKMPRTKVLVDSAKVKI